MTRAGPFVLAPGESRADVKFASGRLAALAGVADTDGALSVLARQPRCRSADSRECRLMAVKRPAAKLMPKE